MKRWILAASLAALPSAALASDLLCKGTFWYNGQAAEGTKVVFFDPSTGRASTESSNGEAKGTLEAKPSLYIGRLTTATGASYWVNLDRYTGSFVMMVEEADGATRRAEFQGTCKKSERLVGSPGTELEFAL